MGDSSKLKGRVFEIMQYLAPTFSDSWEDDRRTLKPGVVPLITQEQIERGLNHRSIKKWGWILHDKDVYTEEDVEHDQSGRIKVDDPKFAHYHVWIYAPGKLSIGQVARWFNVPTNFIEIKRGQGAFDDCMDYATHETAKAIDQGKTIYDHSEVHHSENYDYERAMATLHANLLRYGSAARNMTPAQVMQMHVLQDGWTLRQCRADDPLTYAKVVTTLNRLRLDYLQDSDPCPFRINIYLDGQSGFGKSAACEFIAESLFPKSDKPFFFIGADARVVFDGYDGEPAIIWDEFRAVDFVARFHRQTLTILDNHPKAMAQHVKGSHVILTNAVNIINGIQPYDEFIRGLCGEYVDEDGKFHEAEDVTQSYRRIPLVLCMHSNDFDILINRGFLNHDLQAVRYFDMYRKVVGSFKSVMERLDGVAQHRVIDAMTEPIVSATRLIEERHDDKISDYEDLPPEFLEYGKTLDPIVDESARGEEDATEGEVVDVAVGSVDDKAAAEAEAKALMYQKALDDARNSPEYLEAMAHYELDKLDYEAKVKRRDTLQKYASNSKLVMPDELRSELAQLNHAVGEGNVRKNAPQEPNVFDFVSAECRDVANSIYGLNG